MKFRNNIYKYFVAYMPTHLIPNFFQELYFIVPQPNTGFHTNPRTALITYMHTYKAYRSPYLLIITEIRMIHH